MKHFGSLCLLAGLPSALAFMHGVTGTQDLAYAKSKGANSVKTYDDTQLNAAACSIGLGVYATIPVNPGDSVDAASRKAVDFVNAHKSKECIKMWSIGNELDQKGDPATMMKLAAAVSRAVRGVDGRPRSTCLAGYDRLNVYLEHAAKDFNTLCINCYKCAEDACTKIAASGYKGDYVLGEYGLHGWWEVPRFSGTSMPLEPSSTEKAVQTAAGYKGGVAACAGTGVNAVGAFAFTNERKFEGSATWFGLWASTPAISNNALQPLADRWSTLSSIWSGAAPEPGTVRDKLKGHKLPVIAAIAADKEGRLAPGASFSASATLSDPSLSSSYTGQWEIRADITPGAGASGATGTANAPEPRMYGTGKSADGGLRGGALTVQMQAPSNPGAYRLTLILAPTNGQRGVVTASVPLLIK